MATPDSVMMFKSLINTLYPETQAVEKKLVDEKEKYTLKPNMHYEYSSAVKINHRDGDYIPPEPEIIAKPAEDAIKPLSDWRKLQ